MPLQSPGVRIAVVRCMALLTNEQRILASALSGETAVWTGRPLPGLHLRSGDYSQLGAGVLVTVFLIFWESLALNGGAGILFPLFGAALFCVAFYQTFGQLMWALVARGRTYYAL